MERKQFYFKQPVSYTELNAAFDGVENALKAFVVDFGFAGVINGLQVAQHGAGNLTVDVQPGTSYDEAGDRISVGVTQNVNCAQDYLGTNTAVSTTGHTKILSVFAVFERALSDARTDGNGSTVYFEEADSFQFNLVQGAESAGTPTPPALNASWLLLADLTLHFGDTAILTGSISFARTQYAADPSAPIANDVSAPNATGTNFSLAAGTLTSQLLAIQQAIDAIDTSGVTAIKTVASIAALRAITVTPANGVIAVASTGTGGKGAGLFVWVAASTAADDGVLTVQPTSVSGAGRWSFLDQALPYGVANGVAQLDSGARIALGKPRNGIISITTAAASSGLGWTLLTPSVTVQAGDIIVILLAASGVSGGGACGLSAVGGALTFSPDASAVSLSGAGGDSGTYSVVTAPGNGTYSFSPSIGGGMTVTGIAATFIVIRP